MADNKRSQGWLKAKRTRMAGNRRSQWLPKANRNRMAGNRRRKEWQTDRYCNIKRHKKKFIRERETALWTWMTGVRKSEDGV